MNQKEELLNRLIHSLRNAPEEWKWAYTDERHNIVHATGVRLWVAVGECHVDKPKKVTFGLLGYLRLRSAFRSWRRVQGRKAARQHEMDDAYLVLKILRGDK